MENLSITTIVKIFFSGNPCEGEKGKRKKKTNICVRVSPNHIGVGMINGWWYYFDFQVQQRWKLREDPLVLFEPCIHCQSIVCSVQTPNEEYLPFFGGWSWGFGSGMVEWKNFKGKRNSVQNTKLSSFSITHNTSNNTSNKWFSEICFLLCCFKFALFLLLFLLCVCIDNSEKSFLQYIFSIYHF